MLTELGFRGAPCPMGPRWPKIQTRFTGEHTHSCGVVGSSAVPSNFGGCLFLRRPFAGGSSHSGRCLYAGPVQGHLALMRQDTFCVPARYRVDLLCAGCRLFLDMVPGGLVTASLLWAVSCERTALTLSVAAWVVLVCLIYCETVHMRLAHGSYCHYYEIVRIVSPFLLQSCIGGG